MVSNRGSNSMIDFLVVLYYCFIKRHVETVTPVPAKSLEWTIPCSTKYYYISLVNLSCSPLTLLYIYSSPSLSPCYQVQSLIKNETFKKKSRFFVCYKYTRKSAVRDFIIFFDLYVLVFGVCLWSRWWWGSVCALSSLYLSARSPAVCWCWSHRGGVLVCWWWSWNFSHF